MMDQTSITAAGAIDTFLVLLIGIGPKIALVPFLEITASLDPVHGHEKVPVCGQVEVPGQVGQGEVDAGQLDPGLNGDVGERVG
jgi:hypothetical protein